MVEFPIAELECEGADQPTFFFKDRRSDKCRRHPGFLIKAKAGVLGLQQHIRVADNLCQSGVLVRSRVEVYAEIPPPDDREDHITTGRNEMEIVVTVRLSIIGEICINAIINNPVCGRTDAKSVKGVIQLL